MTRFPVALFEQQQCNYEQSFDQALLMLHLTNPAWVRFYISLRRSHRTIGTAHDDESDNEDNHQDRENDDVFGSAAVALVGLTDHLRRRAGRRRASPSTTPPKLPGIERQHDAFVALLFWLGCNIVVRHRGSSPYTRTSSAGHGIPSGWRPSCFAAAYSSGAQSQTTGKSCPATTCVRAIRTFHCP